jgi:hypothetical protein
VEIGLAFHKVAVGPSESIFHPNHLNRAKEFTCWKQKDTLKWKMVIAEELENVRRLCHTKVKDSKLVACTPGIIRVEIRYGKKFFIFVSFCIV